VRTEQDKIVSMRQQLTPLNTEVLRLKSTIENTQVV
jgi:hypothetical protein